MNKQQLFENIKKKQSFLCVGLDTDIKKIPEHLLKEEDPILLSIKPSSMPQLLTVSLTSRICFLRKHGCQRLDFF